jgi:hypothetical protein
MHYHARAAERKPVVRRNSGDHFLAGTQARILTYIANLDFPSGLGLPRFEGQEVDEFLKRVREKTERLWPEIWQEANAIPPLVPLRRMQKYLRRFWRARDERERDWHIHRAREFTQRHRVLRETAFLSERWRKVQTAQELKDIANDIHVKTEDLLDDVPEPTHMEHALFELQRRAGIPSKRPLYCPDCIQKRPYFLSEKKGTKYCSPECAQAAILVSKSKSWSSHKTEWRSK